jgi:hypothetical protein
VVTGGLVGVGVVVVVVVVVGITQPPWLPCAEQDDVLLHPGTPLTTSPALQNPPLLLGLGVVVGAVAVISPDCTTVDVPAEFVAVANAL